MLFRRALLLQIPMLAARLLDSETTLQPQPLTDMHFGMSSNERWYKLPINDSNACSQPNEERQAETGN